MTLPFAILRRQFSTNSKLFIKHVTVIGGGLMGSGIAQLVAQNGVEVSLLEVNSKVLKKSEENIAKNLRKTAEHLYKDEREIETFLMNTLSKITGMTNVSMATRDCDLIIEAIVENFELKQKLLTEIDQKVPDNTIFVTNTSSFSVRELASCVDRKDRFAGLHFFNPPYVMKLVEVVRIPETSEETYQTLMDFGKAMGKTCITCKDTPGFVVNRLLLPYIGEAIKMYERGDATIEDIDSAMKLGTGMRMGPIELADLIGLDTSNAVLAGWYEKHPDQELFKPSETAKTLISEGKLGIKTGEGFYKYNLK